MNLQGVAREWVRGELPRARAGNVWFGGAVFYSYRTPVAVKLPDGGLAVDTTYYSSSTTKHLRTAVGNAERAGLGPVYEVNPAELSRLIDNLDAEERLGE